MVRGKELKETTRKAIEILSKEGKSERMIASQLQIPKSSVHNTLVRLNNYNTLKSLARTGRPRKTTKRVDAKILNLCKSSETPSAVDIAIELEKMKLADISPRTVRNRLHEHDLYGKALLKNHCLSNPI